MYYCSYYLKAVWVPLFLTEWSPGLRVTPRRLLLRHT